ICVSGCAVAPWWRSKWGVVTVPPAILRIPPRFGGPSRGRMMPGFAAAAAVGLGASVGFGAAGAAVGAAGGGAVGFGACAAAGVAASVGAAFGAAVGAGCDGAAVHATSTPSAAGMSPSNDRRLIVRPGSRSRILTLTPLGCERHGISRVRARKAARN